MNDERQRAFYRRERYRYQKPERISGNEVIGYILLLIITALAVYWALE